VPKKQQIHLTMFYYTFTKRTTQIIMYMLFELSDIQHVHIYTIRKQKGMPSKPTAPVLG